MKIYNTFTNARNEYITRKRRSDQEEDKMSVEETRNDCFSRNEHMPIKFSLCAFESAAHLIYTTRPSAITNKE